MKILVEIEPTRNRRKIEAFVERIAEMPCVWRIAVPDAPLGRPKVSALLLASYLEHAGIPTLVNLRLRDINRIAFEQLIWGAYLHGISYILFLRGDAPRDSRDVDEVKSEDAVLYVKSDKRLSGRIKAGIYLSLRFSAEKVISRAKRTRADFFVVNRVVPNSPAHRAIIAELRNLGEVYAYLITVPRSKLHDMVKQLEGQPVYPIEELDNVVDQYMSLEVDGVIISSPGSLQVLFEALSALCKRLMTR